MSNIPYRIGRTLKVSTAPVLTVAYATNAVGVVTTPGVVDTTAEVQTITPVLDGGSVYKLIFDTVELTTAALDSTPTAAELATAIQAATGYGTAGFTVAASSGNIVITFDNNGPQTEVAYLEYRENVEGPVTSVAAPANHPVVRVVADVAVTLAFGSTIDTEATSDGMLVPANSVEYFTVSEGQYISVKKTGNTDGYVYLTFMTN